jgi:hypothetical protein
MRTPDPHRLIAAFKIEQRGHAYVINARALNGVAM